MENYFIKSKENFQAAQICFDNGLYNASVNRSYYAAYQAAIMALYMAGCKDKDEKYDNKHKWVQATFNGELIHRRKIYPSHLKDFLQNLQTERINSDYKRILISKTIALRQLKKSKELIETIEKTINL